MTDAVETMAYQGETPWHGKGERVDDPGITPAEMIKRARIDWKVTKCAMRTQFKGKTITVPQKKALIRESDGSLLDVVSADWKPVQNEEAFTFFDDFVRKGQMEMHTMGSLHDGQIVWALAKCREKLEIVSGDVIENFLLFTNYHQYGKATDVRDCATRVVCQNTHCAAMGERGKKVIRVNHRLVFDPDKVREMLVGVERGFKEYGEQGKFLACKAAKPDQVDEFLIRLIPAAGKKGERGEMSKPAEQVKAVIDTQPGADFGRGTWWQVLNAVTFAVDHAFCKTQDHRLDSAWYGWGSGKKTQALELALEYARGV